jgi:undecaprenyl-phosphate glucose phosphotransferase
MPAFRRGIIRQNVGKLEFLRRALDGALIVTLLYVSALRSGVRDLGEYHLLATVALFLFVLFSEANGLYRIGRETHSLRSALLKFAEAWGGVVLCLVVLLFATKTSTYYSRGVILAWFFLVLGAVTGLQTGLVLALRELRRRGYNLRRAAIVGAGEMGLRVGAAINENPELGIYLSGYYDERSLQRLELPPDQTSHLRGTPADLLKAARSGSIDSVYITFPLHARDRIQDQIRLLSETTASVYIVPDFLIFDLLRSRWTNLGDVPAVSVVETPFSGVDGLLKRIEDLVLGTILLGMFIAPMAVVALLVWILDGKPILFKQRRYGLDGREILVWKFRTMTVLEDQDDLKQAKRNDPRTTRLGAFLRRTSLDELPQFFNVLQGRMSIVGPRPHPVGMNERYRTLVYRYMVRHKVKPGITGLAQIHGFRGETDTLDKMEKRVGFDLEYIHNWSLFLDFKIIAITTIKSVMGTNAY